MCSVALVAKLRFAELVESGFLYLMRTVAVASDAVNTVPVLVCFEVSPGGELFNTTGVVARHTYLNPAVGKVVSRKYRVLGMA